jgi:hypothetical protein
MKNNFFKAYFFLVFGVLLILLGINFYHAILVSPDTVNMARFQQAILSSTGFLFDLLYFVLSLLLVHSVWCVLLWLFSVGWLRRLDNNSRQGHLIAFLIFLASFLYILILSGRSYPNMLSGFLRHSSWLLSDTIFYVLSFLFAVSAVVSLSVLFVSLSRFRKKFVISLCVICSVVWFGGGLYVGQSLATQNTSEKPNIFIIGIDSLRPDETGFFGGDGDLTPNVDEFLENAQTYESAYTPYARTFPAWMSVLTGLEPVNHKGRFNLINHKHLDKTISLGHQLQRDGYHGIFAFDERRFNSMDETFGYDVVVGPKHAAWSFVASGIDHPIINLLCNTIFGKYLFPGIYLNRGRHGNYDPEKFNQAIIDEFKAVKGKPVFLTTHFLLPHWPWTSRDVEELENYPTPKVPMADSLFRYRMMLKQVDRQFGDFMKGLQAAGQLNNAYVFLISDHGDGFSLAKDNLEPGVKSNAVLETNTRGHATNVFNLGQYRVVMAARHYGGNRIKPVIKKELASIMDIYPTIMDILDKKDLLKGLDGVSMFAGESERKHRQLFLETGFSILELTTSEINMEDMIENGIQAYTVDKQGKLVVKDDYYDFIVSSKHRAIMEGDWMLALVPSMAKYLVLVNRKEKKWWPVDLYEGDKDWGSMLEVMCEHYKGDIGFDQERVCLSKKESSGVSISMDL